MAVAVASLTILDLSKVNVGIPAIEEAFGAGPTDVQLIVAGNVLAFGIVLVPASSYGDLNCRVELILEHHRSGKRRAVDTQALLEQPDEPVRRRHIALLEAGS